MRVAFIVMMLIALLVVGYLVIQNMDSHTRGSDSGQIEEVERAREAARQAKEKVDEIRESVKQSD